MRPEVIGACFHFATASPVQLPWLRAIRQRVEQSCVRLRLPSLDIILNWINLPAGRSWIAMCSGWLRCGGPASPPGTSEEGQKPCWLQGEAAELPCRVCCSDGSSC